MDTHRKQMLELAINNLAVQVMRLADWDMKNFALNICANVDEHVIVVHIGNKLKTVTKDERISHTDNTELQAFMSANNTHSQLTNKKDSFLHYFLQIIEFTELSSSTRTNYLVTYKHLNTFSPWLTFKDVNLLFLLRFEKYLQREGLHINTIGKHMKHIKRIVNSAMDMGYISPGSYPFRRYKIPSLQVKKDYLSFQELNRLEKHYYEVVLPDEEKTILEAFLFSCYTGLRFSDVKTLTASSIKTIGRKKWIVLQQQKTDHEVKIPLFGLFEGKAYEIIRVRNIRRGRVFKDLPDNAKCNRILKSLVKKLGIKKNVSYHSSRHTAGTLLLESGLNITTVQSILGHKTLKLTQRYSKVTEQAIINDLKKWKKTDKK